MNSLMDNSRTKNSVLTIVSSGIRQALTIIMTFVSRTIFIKVLGAEFLGLNGLFTNILSIFVVIGLFSCVINLLLVTDYKKIVGF